MKVIALDPGVRELPLNNGGVTLVDEETYEWAKEVQWHKILKDGNWYVRNTKRVYLHHLVLGHIEYGKNEIDHINGNTLDNRKINLRFCNSSQNKFNKGRQSNNHSSQFKGVTYDKSREKWMAQLNAYGVKRLSKRFDTEEEAARAYDEAAKIHHGEFARLNFPGESC